MNIAYILSSLANKGPVLVVRDLVEQMVKNNQQCVVFYFDEIQEVKFNCQINRIKFKNKIDFEQFDIVHSHGIRPDMYVFFHKPYKSNTCFVTTLHNYVLRDLSYQYNKLIAYSCGNLWMGLLRRHDKIVTLSKDAMKYYQKWFHTSHLTYAYNTRCISMAQTLNPSEKKEIIEFKGDFILLGINALPSPTKGIDQLIQALPSLPQYRLCIVGDGKSLESLKQLADKLGVKKQVLFTGYKKDAYRYLPFYDIYVQPSRSEGFPLALLEAAVAGLPVVCSDIPIFKEIVSEEVVFFELENIPSLVTAIRNATDNKELACRLQRKYWECYSPEIFYKRYMHIYQSL